MDIFNNCRRTRQWDNDTYISTAISLAGVGGHLRTYVVTDVTHYTRIARNKGKEIVHFKSAMMIY